MKRSDLSVILDCDYAGIPSAELWRLGDVALRRAESYLAMKTTRGNILYDEWKYRAEFLWKLAGEKQEKAVQKLSALAILVLLIFMPSLAAQTLPANWAGAGAAYNGYSRPQVNGWASYAKLLTEKGGGLYSFTSWDVTSARTKPFTTQTSARTGIATIVKQVGPFYVLGFGDAGMASSSDGFGGAFSGGGIGVWKIGKTSFTFVAAARVLRVSNGATQTVYELGFGRCY